MEEEEIQKQEKFMVRDSDQTKYYLWSAYEGYEEHFGNYLMYKRIGVEPKEIIAGLHKYMIKFFYQIKYNWQQFKGEPEENKITQTQINRYQTIITKDEPNKEDYVFLMNFIEQFMYISGVKNIVFKKDNPGESIKKNR